MHAAEATCVAVLVVYDWRWCVQLRDSVEAKDEWKSQHAEAEHMNARLTEQVGETCAGPIGACGFHITMIMHALHSAPRMLPAECFDGDAAVCRSMYTVCNTLLYSAALHGHPVMCSCTSLRRHWVC